MTNSGPLAAEPGNRVVLDVPRRVNGDKLQRAINLKKTGGIAFVSKSFTPQVARGGVVRDRMHLFILHSPIR